MVTEGIEWVILHGWRPQGFLRGLSCLGLKQRQLPLRHLPLCQRSGLPSPSVASSRLIYCIPQNEAKRSTGMRQQPPDVCIPLGGHPWGSHISAWICLDVPPPLWSPPWMHLLQMRGPLEKHILVGGPSMGVKGKNGDGYVSFRELRAAIGDLGGGDAADIIERVAYKQVRVGVHIGLIMKQPSQCLLVCPCPMLEELSRLPCYL
eukprot:1143867-Pelagomonas_calceolata.AAC.1